MISKRKLITRALILVFFFFFCDGSASVHAASIAEGDPIMQKIIYTSAVECYKGNEMKDSVSLGVFDGTIASLDSTGFNDLNKGVPFYGSETRRCDELLTYDTTNHFNSNTNPVDNYPERREILEKMAYSEVPGSGGSAVAQCVSYPYQIEFQGGSGSFSTTTPKVCASKTDDGWVFSVDDNVGWQNTGSGDHGVPIYFKPVKTNSIKIFYRGGKGIFSNDKWETYTVDGSTDSVAQVLADLGTKIASLVGSTSGTSTVASNLNNPNGVVEEAYFYALCGRYSVPTWSTGIKCDGKSEYDQIFPTVVESDILFDKIKNYNKLVNILSSGKWAYSPTDLFVNKDSLIFSNMQKYRLYQSYLVDVYGATIQCLDTDWAGAGEGPIKLWDTARNKYNNNCFAAIDDSKKGITVYGIYDTGYFGKGEMKYTDVITQLNALDLGNVAPESPIDTGDGDPTTIDGAISEGCYGAGLESQSWILCPTLNNMTSVVDGLDDLVDGMLSVDTNYFDHSGKTREAWEIFRNIANTIMVVVLLVIIFSQLTGYGIDNYGIKKMLPKLVLMAILINLSFFICELAIDLSNILGKGLDQLFRGMGNSVYSGDSSGQWVADLVAVVFGGAAATGAIGSGAIAVSGMALGSAGPMIVISLILALLVALVAVLMFFLIVGARLMIIILFTAASPVAFACYILPNTQKIFKKWWDIFKAALIVYPICGALYGLSYLVRGIVSDGSGASFPLLLVATVAPFLPFLALPSLLKGAISGLGAVSGAITSIGNGLRKGLSRGNQTLQGTNAYKNQQEAQRRNLTRWRAGVTKDADGKYTSRDLSGIGRFLRGGKSGISDARAQLLRDENAQAKEDSYMGEGFDAAVIGQQKAVEADTTKDYMTLANSLTQNGEDKEALYNLYRKYEEDGNKSGMVAVARIAGRRKDTASDFMKEFTKNGKVLNASAAKEISTGENSGMYRSSNPFMFEYAAQLNKGEFKGSFDQWKTPDNLNKAVKNYITSAKDLVGMKGDALETLKEAMGDGRFDPETKARIRTLATDAIESRAYNNEFDSTKAKQVAELSGAYEYKIKNNRAVFEKQQNATEFDVPHGDGPVDDAGQII